MGFEDRLGNKGEELAGKAKEALGNASDNDELRNEGKADQASAGLKDKIEDVKDTVTDAIDNLRGKNN
ncbi:CsbD family protein [Gulosibacter chungangensis]|uniref:CsbD family protein n=1 Tax=Gulosibacter chungangensis TaxID=979746 RepID=A0A7J5BD01_9MICO|nr:CsbD family protein [Gulosibacter chungangensis]KAB1643479.1 CsbD family protein [Gulosibacter chungangensis]